MRFQLSTILALSMSLAACAGARPRAAAPEAAAAKAPLHQGLNIKLATIYVDDQEKALHFYTDVLGFAKKDDVSNSGYRWLTVTAPGDGEGTALQLAADNNPAAKAYKEAIFQQGQPAMMFYTADIQGDYERIKARGAEFTMAPTKVMADSTIAMVKDTCGNLIQITQLAQP